LTPLARALTQYADVPTVCPSFAVCIIAKFINAFPVTPSDDQWCVPHTWSLCVEFEPFLLDEAKMWAFVDAIRIVE
jgi:hypothetical protein